MLCVRADECFGCRSGLTSSRATGASLTTGRRSSGCWRVSRGLSERRAAIVYQAGPLFPSLSLAKLTLQIIVSSILLRPHATEIDTTMLYSTSSIRVQVEEARMEILRWVGVRNEGGFNLHVSSFTLMSTQKSRVYRPHLTRRHPQSPPLRPPDSISPKDALAHPPAHHRLPRQRNPQQSRRRCRSARACSPATRMKRSVTPSQKEQAAGLSASSVRSPPPVERLMDRKEIDARPSSFDVCFRWPCNVYLLSQG